MEPFDEYLTILSIGFKFGTSNNITALQNFKRVWVQYSTKQSKRVKCKHECLWSKVKNALKIQNNSFYPRFKFKQVGYNIEQICSP